jgi:hypothetical protein
MRDFMVLWRGDSDFDVLQGRHVDQVDGNENLKWEVSGASGKAVIALSYIFVGVYGATWV